MREHVDTCNKIINYRNASFQCVALFFGLVFVVTPKLRPRPRRRRGSDQSSARSRNKIEAELESIAIIDRKVMVPMRDGKRMAADIYRPKDTSKK